MEDLKGQASNVDRLSMTKVVVGHGGFGKVGGPTGLRSAGPRIAGRCRPDGATIRRPSARARSGCDRSGRNVRACSAKPRPCGHACTGPGARPVGSSTFAVVVPRDELPGSSPASMTTVSPVAVSQTTEQRIWSGPTKKVSTRGPPHHAPWFRGWFIRRAGGGSPSCSGVRKRGSARAQS